MFRARCRYYRYIVVQVHVQLIWVGYNIVLLVDVVSGDVLHVDFLLRVGGREVLSSSVWQHSDRFLVMLLVLHMPRQ